MEKIDKSTLMAYLYGELSEAEAAQVTRILEENPDAREEWRQASATRIRLSHLKDEPVHEPLVLPGLVRMPARNGWQKWAAVAAIVVVGVFGAAWLQVRISFRNHELAIRFGEPEPIHPVMAENQNAIADNSRVVPAKTVAAGHTSLSDSDRVALFRIALLEQTLQRQIQELRLRQSTLQARQTGLTEAQVTELINDLQQDNFETMQQVLLTSNQQQQLYSQKMLAQLTDYLATQRKEDLQKINAVLNTIVQNTDQKQQQTDLVLTQVISKLNEKNPKQRN